MTGVTSHNSCAGVCVAPAVSGVGGSVRGGAHRRLFLGLPSQVDVGPFGAMPPHYMGYLAYKKNTHVGPYSSPTPRVLGGVPVGVAASYERGTPVFYS
jgi:hypothetical protein